MSITYELFQDTLIYPPQPGEKGGPCVDERCGDYDCYRMRKDAAFPCPTCGQPVGYGNVMRMKAILVPVYPAPKEGEPKQLWRLPDYRDDGFREVTNEHEACYQARIERERADAEAQEQQERATSDALAETEAQAEALAAGEREQD